MDPPVKNIWGYGRQSRDETKQVYTERAQRAAIERYAESLIERCAEGIGSLQYAGLFFDRSESRGVPLFDRPYGRELLKVLRRGDHLVTTNVDRMLGSLIYGAATLETLKQLGVQLHFLNLGIDASTAGGELVLHIMIAVAQHERRLISERTKAAAAIRRENGEPWGTPPLGWRQVGRKKDAKFAPDHAQRAAAAEIGRKRREGKSYACIAQELTSANGRSWSTSTVHRYHQALLNRFPLARKPVA